MRDDSLYLGGHHQRLDAPAYRLDRARVGQPDARQQPQRMGQHTAYQQKLLIGQWLQRQGGAERHDNYLGDLAAARAIAGSDGRDRIGCAGCFGRKLWRQRSQTGAGKRPAIIRPGKIWPPTADAAEDERIFSHEKCHVRVPLYPSTGVSPTAERPPLTGQDEMTKIR